MKKHLALIVGSYYPNPSPTGKCADGYVELLRDEYDISVVCLGAQRESFTYAGKQVYPTAGAYARLQMRLEKAPGFLRNLAKIPVHLHQRFTQPNNLFSYVKAAHKQLQRIHKRRPVDVIFSVGAPMAAHVAAKDFRKDHPQVRWVSYTVDSYASQNKGTCGYQKALEFEASVLGQSDRVLLSEEIYENNPVLYSTFAEKCGVLPYQMPPTPSAVETERYFDPDKVNLVYGGRFYKELRNPEYLLQLAMQMEDNCVLHLYCQSDCDSLIDGYVQRSGGKILRHAPVSVEQIQKIYSQADVLVSVGNNTAEFKPSKTFEYIASGKPILNIYYEGQRDTVLEQYPLCLQLERITPIQSGGKMLCKFINDVQNKQLTGEEIEKIFFRHSSENIKHILRSAMNG